MKISLPARINARKVEDASRLYQQPLKLCVYRATALLPLEIAASIKATFPSNVDALPIRLQRSLALECYVLSDLFLGVRNLTNRAG